MAPHTGRTGGEADQSCTRPLPQPPQQSCFPGGSDAGTVRVSGRDIAGLMLCGEMYVADIARDHGQALAGGGSAGSAQV